MLAYPPISALLDALETARQRWSRYRSERMLRSLPPDIRKDIGWPDLQRSRQPQGRR
jgi:hypothetical protein